MKCKLILNLESRMKFIYLKNSNSLFRWKILIKKINIVLSHINLKILINSFKSKVIIWLIKIKINLNKISSFRIIKTIYQTMTIQNIWIHIKKQVDLLTYQKIMINYFKKYKHLKSITINRIQNKNFLLLFINLILFQIKMMK